MRVAFLMFAAIAAAQGPTFRAGTRIVEVAVVAKDANDAPITDLREEDLRLFHNGVEQSILLTTLLGVGAVGTFWLVKRHPEMLNALDIAVRSYLFVLSMPFP